MWTRRRIPHHPGIADRPGEEAWTVLRDGIPVGEVRSQVVSAMAPRWSWRVTGAHGTADTRQAALDAVRAGVMGVRLL